MKKSVVTLVLGMLLCAAPVLFAVSPYPALRTRAERAFHFEEWASAAALFDLMLEQKPDVPRTYAQAIVANAMCGQTDRTSELTTSALDNHIPFDTVFSNVREWSFFIGQPTLFENFLKQNREAHPWMRRTINAYLLKYYAFRRDGASMIEYAGLLLPGAPDNVEFLSVLADGYMLTGRFGEGVATYERILDIYPDNYDTLLTLGNWHMLHSEGSDLHSGEARRYLERAYALRPTPHVRQLLDRLVPDDGGR